MRWLLERALALQVVRGLRHIFRLAEIAPIVFIGAKGDDCFSAGSNTQIGSDDGEGAFLRHHRQKTRRDYVDASESQRLDRRGRWNRFSLLIAPGTPAAKLKLLVEEQVSSRLAVLHGQGGESLLLLVKLHHAPEIDGADDIDIVQKEWFREPAGIFEKKPRSLLQAAARVEQDLLARDLYAHAEVIVSFQIIDDHVGEVMHVDDHLADPAGAQAGECDLQQGAAGDFHERLGAIVGEGPQARTEAGGQDHRFHIMAFTGPGSPAPDAAPQLPPRC